MSQREFEARAHRAEELALRVKRCKAYTDKIKKLQYGHGKYLQHRGPTVNVPELDPNAAAGALALLAGGAFVLVDRNRRVRLG